MLDAAIGLPSDLGVRVVQIAGYFASTRTSTLGRERGTSKGFGVESRWQHVGV